MPTLPKKLLPAACAQFRATYLSDNACHHQPAQRGGRHSSAHASYFVPLLPFRSRGRIFMNDLVRKVEKHSFAGGFISQLQIKTIQYSMYRSSA